MVASSAARDPAALNAVAAAVNDADWRVREAAAEDMGNIGKPTPKVMAALRAALPDIEVLVQQAAMESLGRFLPDKEALDALLSKMGVPPKVNLYAASVLNNRHIDDPRVLNALIFEATQKNAKYAIEALAQDPGRKGAAPALLLALGTPPNVNLPAMHILDRIGSEDPRLISALIYQATVKNDLDAITALGRHPQNKDAVNALLSVASSAPENSSDRAISALTDERIDDPRFTEVLLAKADGYNAPAVGILLKKAPLTQDVIAQFLQHLKNSLTLPENYRAQIYIDLLLHAGTAPGRQALHHLIATSDARTQSMLALAWLEVEPDARAEIASALQPGDETYLVKLTKTPTVGTVALPAYDTSGQQCDEGPSLRAVMGLSLLNLAQSMHPTSILINAIKTPTDSCAAYAAAAVAWLGPPALKTASTNLVFNARCRDGMAQKAASDTLAIIGDERTISQLQTINDTYNREYVCDLAARQQNPDGPYRVSHDQDELIAKIRNRLNAKK